MPSEVILSLFIGPIAVSPVPRAVMEALVQAEVKISASDKSGFDLTFAVSTDSEITTDLLPNGYFDPPSRVVIAVAFAGSTTVLVDGVITQHEITPSDEPGKSILSIKGEDLTRMMDLIDLSGLPYPAMAAEARVALMLVKYTPIYGIVPLVIPSVLIDVVDPLDKIPAQKGTDLAYIKLLADRVGYSFFLQAGPEPGASIAYWGPMLKVSIPFLNTSPDIAIDWDGRSNVESLGFTLDGFAENQYVVLIHVDGSPIPIPIPVPDVNPISPPLGQKRPQVLKITPLQGLAKYDPVQAAAIALARAANDANVVSGQGTLDVVRYGGILNARTLVNVRGVGITYDGTYFVESVTHTIKSGSYKQSFTLSRNRLIAGNGLPGDPASILGTPVQQLGALVPPAAPTTPLSAIVNAVAGPVGPSGVPGSGGVTAGPNLPASPAS